MQKNSRKTSGDGLDDYIRVSSPGLLVIVGAMSLVLVATVVWGFIGRIPVTITMPDHTTFKGNIESVFPYPLSKDEARLYLKNSDWVVEQCVTSNYSWGIAVRVNKDISGHLFTTPQVTIITDEVPPIRFLTR